MVFFFPRKYMGLKAKVCFAGDMGLGFGSLVEIDNGEEHREHEHILLKK